MRLGVVGTNYGRPFQLPAFRTDPRFWLNLQAAYDLSKAEKAHSYKKIVPRTAA